VLSEVGLVRCRADGRRRLYRLEPARLRPFHEWLAKYEQAWNDRLDRVDDYLQELSLGYQPDNGRPRRVDHASDCLRASSDRTRIAWCVASRLRRSAYRGPSRLQIRLQDGLA
jgi:hypothetical protein